MIKFLLNKWHRRTLIIISLLLLIPSSFYTYKLFLNVKSDLSSLLPSNSHSLIDIQASRERFPSIDCLLMIVFSDTAQSGENFIYDFVARVEKANHPIIGSVVYNIRDDVSFFIENIPLYYPLGGLEELQDKLISHGKKTKNIIDVLKRRLSQYKKVDDYKLFKDLLRLPNGNLCSRSGRIRALLIFHSKPMVDIKNAMELSRFIKDQISELQKNIYYSDLQFKFSGLANTLLNEYHSLWSDIRVSITITSVLVLLLLLMFFRTFKIIFPICYVLATGMSVTFAISYFAFHQLNTNSVFMASIIIGNAINSGIILASYFLHERKNGKSAENAISNAIKISFKPTLIGTVASSLAFGSLILSDSRGFFDFGSIGLWGMVISWICTYLFLPPLLISKPFQLNDNFLKKYKIPFITIWEKISSQIFRWRYCIAVVTVILATGAVIFLLITDYEYLEKDSTKLRSKDYIKTNFQTFNKYLSRLSLKKEMFPSILVLTNNPEDVLKLQRIIRSDKVLQKIVPGIKTFTVQNAIPDDQINKLEIINKIRSTKLTKKALIKGKLKRGEISILKAIYGAKDWDKIEIKNLPNQLKKFFTEIDGTTGKLLFISVNLNKLEQNLFKMIGLVDRLNEISEKTLGKNNYHCTGIIPITTELANMMIKDGSRCISFAFIGILIVFLIFYRKIKLFPMMVLNFCFAMILFCALIPLCGIKINFLNFIAIPLTFGIGVDYSSNIIQNVFIREEHHERMKNTLLTTGPFIIVGSLTTIIGYSSLIFTRTMALSSFGILCLVGEIITLLGALLILPALFSIFYKDKI